MRDRVNVRLAAALLVGLAVASAAVAGVQRWQVRRLAPGLLDIARAAEDQGRTDRAAGLVAEYLAFAPGDADARGRYARLLEDMARDAKGLNAVADEYERAIQADPGRAADRARLAKVYVKTGRYPDALPHLTALNAEASADAEMVELVAVCRDAANDRPAAERAYRRAIELDPKPVGRSTLLAGLLRRAGNRTDDADRVMDKLVAANPESAAAYLARARYRITYNTGDPGPDLRTAEKLAPHDIDVRLVAAAAAKEPAAAREHLKVALDQHPGDQRVYFALAGVEVAAGNAAAAADLYRRAAARKPGDPRPLFALAELAVLTRDSAGAERALAELARWKHPAEQIGLLRGRLRMAEGNWTEARKEFEAVRPTLAAAAAARAAEADVLLARCHEQLGEDDLALAAYRRAAAGDPTRADAAAGAARSLVRGGRLGEAIEQYRQLVRDPNTPADTWLLYARLRTMRYLATPPVSRRASVDIEPAFEEVAAKVPGAAELVILRAEVLAADRRPADAEKLLRAAVAERPDLPDLAIPLAQLLARYGKLADAWGVLDAVEQKAGPTASLCLTRLRLVPTAADERAGPAVAAAEALLARPATTPADRTQVTEALADAHTRWGDAAAARRRLDEVARLKPTDLGVRFRLLDLAVAAGDADRMDAAVRDIRRAEGTLGPVGHYAEAVLRLVRRKPPTAADLAEAREHLSVAALARPAWASLPVARAAVALADRRPDDALAEYLRAVELGERRPAVIRQVVRMLCDRRRYGEADRLVQRLGPDGYLSGELNRLAAEVSLFNLQPDRAVELAGAAVPAASPEIDDHIWKAELLAAAGRPKEATEAFRRATAVANGAGRPWVALVRHLVRAGEKTQAEAVVAELDGKLTPAERLPTMAACLEAVGRAEPAAKAYLQAADANPADLEAARQLAGFHDRAGTQGKAVPALRRTLAAAKTPTDQAEARRLLASALVAGGEYATFREAVALLDQNLAADPRGPADLAAKARVLATRLPFRRDALRLLQQAQQAGPLDPVAEFLHAQLLADTGAWPDGRRRLIDLVSRGADDPARLRFLVDRLLRNNQPEEAGVWLDRLEQAAANDPEALRLRAAWLVKRGEPRDAADRLRRAGAGGREQARAAAGVAVALARETDEARAALGPVAEELYRRAADGGTPADALALAGCLATRGKLDEGLELCRATKAAPVEVAAALVGIAYAPARLDDAQLAAVEREVNTVLPRVEPVATREAVAGVMHARAGRYADAAAAFRRAATGGEGGAAMLNNAGYMLLLAGRPAAEVEPLVAEAIAAVGPVADLLDTRGTVRLLAGRSAEAVADLEAAVEQEPTAARCLHLATAYHKANRRADANRLLARAGALKSDGSLLVPAEQQGFERLTRELSRGPGAGRGGA